MYNRVILMGRLTADPELKQTQNGVNMCRLRVAVDRGYAKQGEERQTDFINVVCWRQTAEFVSRYFSKGRMIHVEGRLQNNDYTDQNNVKHYSMVVIADNVAFCGDKSQNQQIDAQTAPQTAQNAAYSNAATSNNNNSGMPPRAAQPSQNAPVQLGNLNDFEEILSDGETPF